MEEHKLFFGMEEKKKCNKCGEWKDKSKFSKDKRVKDGLTAKCKKCLREYKRKYYKDNRNKIKEINKKYYRANKDVFKEKSRNYYLNNKEKIKQDVKNYALKNSEKISDYRKSGRQENKDYIQKYNKKYRQENRDILNKENRNYYLNNKDRIDALNKKYRQENKNRIKEYEKKYRQENKNRIKEENKIYRNSYIEFNSNIKARKEIELYEEIKESPDNNLMCKCTYCGEGFEPIVTQIKSRIRAINGETRGDLRLYCSTNCKSNCSIYNQNKGPKDQKPATSREVQPELRQMVFERDNYTCQKCNIHKDNLNVGIHCHHVEGILGEPLQSADIDMCITLCEDCHKEVHGINGCGYYEMRCIG